MSLLTDLTRFSVVNSEFVHELQKERGMTAGFIGSKGKRFTKKLLEQREITNQKKHLQEQYILEHSFNIPQIDRLNEAINQDLSNLRSIRQQVDAQTIPVSLALVFYTQLNEKLLSVSKLNASISTNAILTKETIAYYNFLQGKERAGIERAVLNNAFSENKFSDGMFAKFIGLVTEQHMFFDNFNAFSSQKNRSFFAQQLNHNSVKEVIKLRDIATSKLSGFNVDAEYWFTQSTDRIGQLKNTEIKLSSELIALASDAKSTAYRKMMWGIIFTIVLIIIVFSTSTYIIKELSSHVQDLILVMSKVEKDSNLMVRATFLDQSELGQIALALNSTLSRFTELIKNILSSSEMLASASEETSQTCEHNSTLLLSQQEGVRFIATAIEELSATVKEIANSTQQAATSAKETNGQAQIGFGVVKKSSQSIEILATEIESLSDKITNLHQSSSDITKVVDVIKSVADQTNLLALNAAIEAARAGEQGRGFAVVADEVRTLAQRTQQSTAEIENFINALQSDSTEAFNLIETSQKMTQEAVNNSKEVEQTLTGITGAISEIFEMTEKIAESIEQQSIVTQEVAKNIVNIEEKSIESTVGATQIASTAKAQKELAIKLKDMAHSFRV